MRVLSYSTLLTVRDPPTPFLSDFLEALQLVRFQNYVDIFLGVSLVIVSVCTFIKPFSPYLWIYITASAIEAFAYAGIDLCKLSVVHQYQLKCICHVVHPNSACIRSRDLLDTEIEHLLLDGVQLHK